jgi:CRISPR-associated protein Csy1
LQIEWQRLPDPRHADTLLQALLDSPLAERADAGALALASARAGRVEVCLDRLMRVDADTRVRVALQAADALRATGEVQAAIDAGALAYHASDSGRHSPGLRGALPGLALAPVMRSREAIRTDRVRLQRALTLLEQDWTPSHLARCEARLEQLAWSNFHLAYHGENDRALQQTYAGLLQRAAASFMPHLAEPPPARASCRVGLLSSCWRECTVGSYFGGWIDWLRDAGYHVHLYQLGPQRDATTERLADRASVFRFHRGDLGSLAETIRNDALDLLIYPELGMDARLLPLAALRLAARQAVAWGHPVTSGFTTMDGFFSCRDMEVSDASAHYVEPLMPLSGLGVAYARPEAPPPATRAELGLPPDAPLLLLPHSLFKLHPDDDEVLADIALQSPRARFVLFCGEHPAWQAQYLERLRKAFGARGIEPASHLIWLAPGSRTRFRQIAQTCDLMLDSLRWSGGNTSLDALSLGLPVISCPGDVLRARQSAAMLERLGLASELVCESPTALAAATSNLLRDGRPRDAFSARIRTGLERLFESEPARGDFLRHVERLCTPEPTR